MIHTDTFFENFKPISGVLSAFQREGVKFIIDGFEACPYLTDHRHLAYMLATTKHETANTYRPIAEYGKGKGRQYGIPACNGNVYYGRGYVQLTWERNYKVMQARLKALGIETDLVNNPDDAMKQDIALQIMFVGMHEGLFTGKKLKDYFNEWCDDAVHARKIINGLDKAKMIAGYYYEFNSALKAARNA